MVTFFGVLAIPLGLVHIAFVMSQSVVVGEWCTCCLLVAAIMLPTIPLEIDEVIAEQCPRLADPLGLGLPAVRLRDPGESQEGEDAIGWNACVVRGPAMRSEAGRHETERPM